MTSLPDERRAVARRPYIDWARGVAVLVMIHAHVLDSWTLRAERGAPAYGYLTFIGGLAAPLFLWLAGIGLALAVERGAARTGDRRAAALQVCRRGLQIYALAFLFRLQAFIVSPGNPLVSLLRVDILNIMGPGIAAAATVWWALPRRRTAALACAGIAAGLAFATPLVRTAAWLAQLPPFLQWYVSPAGNHSTFTLFPWVGFVFAGAACGGWLAFDEVDHGATPSRRRAPVATRVLGLAGVVLGAASLFAATLPTIYRSSSFWTTSPTYFGARVGLLMVVLALLAELARMPHLPQAPFSVLQRFGCRSLFVYWIHVELVYGYASLLLHHRLPLWGTAVAYVVFTALMYTAIELRDRVVAAWRGRQTGGAAPHPVQA